MTFRQSVIRFCAPLEEICANLTSSARAWIASVLFVVIATESIFLAAKRPLWFDELITVYLSHLGFRNLLIALKDGADTNPPLLYPPVSFVERFTSSPALAIRLPSIVFFLVCLFFIYRLARPYTSPAFAILAGVVPEITFARPYSFEGRSYACVLACAAIALFAWREMCGGRKRMSYAVVLAVSLAVAISSHYSAALIFGVLAVGETFRITQKRVDWLTMSAIASGAIPLFFLRQELAAIHIYLAAYWSRPTFVEVLLDWVKFLVPGTLVFIVLAAFAMFLAPVSKLKDYAYSKVPAYERAVWICLLCAPLIGFIQGKITGGFTIRYALPMVIPFALIFAFGLQSLSRASSAFAYMSIGLILLGTTSLNFRNVRIAAASAKETQAELAILGRASENEPLIIADSLNFSPLFYYSSPQLQTRLAYLSDPTLAAARVGFNSSDLTLRHLAPISPINVFDYRTFVDSHPTFLVLLDPQPSEWLGKQLALDHIALTPQACYGFGCIYRAHR